MSQNYVIFKDSLTNELDVLISTLPHDILKDAYDYRSFVSCVSAGTVTFIKGLVHVEADVTHGSIVLKFPVNPERAQIDKGIIEKLFL